MYEDSIKFKEFMASVPNGQLSNFIDAICDKCQIRRPTYNNWRVGKTKVPTDAKEKIEKLAGKKIW